MLNSTIIMFKALFVLPLLFFAQTAQPMILSPQTGQTLRGQADIIGNVDVPNFSSAELAFSYAADANSWFVIQTFSQVPETQNLAVWDTTLLTDGDYILHLRVFLQDGSSEDVVVSGLKIRNNEISATETPTPTEEFFAQPATATLPSFETATPTPIFPTPTNFPPNPATLTPTSIFYYFARGGFVAIVVIFLFSLILRSRKN